jgi:hypothetical protein
MGIFIIIAVVAVVCYVWADAHDERQRAKYLEEDSAFLEKNENKEALVKFQDLDMNTHTYGPFEAFISRWGEYSVHDTAKQRAETYLENCFERGYFKNNEGKSFPSCNVKRAWVEEIAK